MNLQWVKMCHEFWLQIITKLSQPSHLMLRKCFCILKMYLSENAVSNSVVDFLLLTPNYSPFICEDTKPKEEMACPCAKPGTEAGLGLGFSRPVAQTSNLSSINCCT